MTPSTIFVAVRSLATTLTVGRQISLPRSQARLLKGGRLTEKQQACLDRIVTKLKLAGLWEGEQW